MHQRAQVSEEIYQQVSGVTQIIEAHESTGGEVEVLWGERSVKMSFVMRDVESAPHHKVS